MYITSIPVSVAMIIVIHDILRYITFVIQLYHTVSHVAIRRISIMGVQTSHYPPHMTSNI